MPYVPLTWLADHVEVPAGTTAEQLAADLVRVGLEEESIDRSSAVTGPLVVGRVLEATPEEQRNGRTITWCRVDVGEHNDDSGSRGIVCGAHNVAVGDAVVVALPGAVLPGDFVIAARKTYGHVSDGMMCSQRELGLGDDQSGIIVLEEPAPAPGTDAVALLGLGEEILEINVTPDRGYCFSMRGVAREYAHSTGAAFTDHGLPTPDLKSATEHGFAVEVGDDAPIHDVPGCDRFVTRVVRGIDATAATPEWMQRRLRQAGMRPISLAVDVTNYVMLDLGQPLHAYDVSTLVAPIVVRRARAGEKLTTLDGVTRDLHVEDLLITDSPEGSGSRILGLAGVMGGAETEVSARTTDVLIEAAHFDAVSVARTARRHRLPSEAAKRFERGVDTALQAVAAQRVVDLLVEHGGGRAGAEVSDLDTTRPPGAILLDAGLPSRLVGVEYSAATVRATLESLGAHVEEHVEATVDGVGRHARAAARLVVTPPTWRSDLTEPADLVEEVVRLQGYDQVPSILPSAAPGRGLTRSQRQRRTVARTLAAQGFVEVLTYPFVGASRHDELALPADDDRRHALRLVNPLTEAQPLLRTSLLHTLVDAAVRNVGRGLADLAIVEIGMVTRPGVHRSGSPLPPPGARPADDVLAAVRDAVPHQPMRVAGVLTGDRVPGGVHTAARRADHADAIAAVQSIAAVLDVPLVVAADTDHAPWHPGRCARFTTVGGELAGHAGELAPKVTTAVGLPARTVAFEVDLDVLLAASPDEAKQVSVLSAFPAAKEDIALVVASDVPAGDVLAAVREGAGELAEEVRLFDVYTGPSVGEGRKSLAFSLRLRAADRTLTAADTAGVREAVVSLAAERLGAELRS